MMIDFDGRAVLIGMGVLCIILPVLRWQKRSLSYLLFFSIFWTYLLAVVQVVIFPIFTNTNPSNARFIPSINLLPFYFGDCSMFNLCVRGIAENILLTIPFGFGINFLIKIKPTTIPWLAIFVGFAFEFSQLVISVILRSGYRTIDISDVIFNNIGVLIGYGLFRMFAWLYVRVTKYFNLRQKWIFADVYEIALQAQVVDG
jgi:glycopeptide antibiotics resistance protein